jgi:3-methyl-2-oxobutanoate hydroxymethyltransferase
MRTTILDIRKMKTAGTRIPMVTAYDATMARLVEAAGIPLILVGDSLGMVIQGNPTTIPVTLDEMIYHAKMVMRGTRQALVVGDMPFMTYKISHEQALTNTTRMMQEGGVGAIKLEGGAEVAPLVERLTGAGIPVMAHIGLTPQSVHQLGGWRAQGRDVEAAQRLVEDAAALEKAGAFAIVLETIPARLAQEITRRLAIPTFGIGAGPGCDGQVQVLYDLLGLLDDMKPKHAKQYATLAAHIREAVGAYVREVQQGSFPTEAHSIKIDEAVLAALRPEPPDQNAISER